MERSDHARGTEAVGFGEYSLHVDWNYRSRVNFATVNSLSNSQPAYGLVNARIG